MSSKKSIYNRKRYWYHLSSTLTKKEHRLTPWDNYSGFNRSYTEPNTERICVGPSIAHCLTAIPYYLSGTYTVYRTKNKVIANEPKDIFDARITEEGWLQTPTKFVRIGVINLEEIESGERVKHVIPEAASGNEPRYSGKVLKWWKRVNFRKYLRRS